jgi:hypothetical protein
MIGLMWLAVAQTHALCETYNTVLLIKEDEPSCLVLCDLGTGACMRLVWG